MKRLTFQNQIMIGILGLGVGHLLWYLTDLGIFVNLAFILYGMLFLIHPAVPEGARSHPRIRTWLRLVGAAFILLGCTMKNGGGESLWQDRISDDLGIDAGAAQVQESMDSHGGFHGDGTTCVVLDFSNKPLTGCPAGEGWHDLPLTENIQTLIYGTAGQTGARGPYLDVTVPRAERGFWFFYDRQGDSFRDEAVLERHSFGYTFALYDEDTDRLWFVKYDT